MSATENVHSPECKSEAVAAKKAALGEGSIRERILAALASRCRHPEWNESYGCLICGQGLAPGTVLGGPGHGGMTPEAFASETGLLLNTVRRRFTDLWKDGLVRWNGRYVENDRGNPSKVWALGCDPDRLKAAPRATAARVVELEEENVRLRTRVDYLEARCLLLEKGKQSELFS